MARPRSRDLAVGAMFALALVILALTVMAVGTESRLFADKVAYQVNFPTAEGLVIGSPVKMSGVQVGSVSGIRLSPDPGEQGIAVSIGIDRLYAERVREDSRAELGILQLLSGEKFVNVTPGEPEQPQLAENSVIETSTDPEILKQAAEAAENLNDITVSLKNILEKLETGEGLISQMINDPEFGKQGLDAMRGAAENLQGLTADLRRGRGFVGRLLTDRKFAARVDDLGAAVDRFASVMEKIDSGQGAVGALLEENGAGQQAVEDLRAAAASLKTVGQRLESSDGLVGKLINDTEYSRQIAGDLETVVANLAQITEKINSGQGTLGALINERTLHDGLESVAAGVDDSKFARWLIRHYRKKGIKIEDAQAAGGGSE